MTDPTLLRHGVVAPAHPTSTAVGIRDGRIDLIGTEDEADRWLDALPERARAAVEVIDLEGALVAPAFVDTHVHTVRTGFALTGLDLSTHTGPDGRQTTLASVAAYADAHPEQAVIVGQGWDETRWSDPRPPTGSELGAAAPGRRTYLTRIDAHSSVVSPTLSSLVPGLSDLDGWSSDGRVERDAHHAVRHTLETLISDEDRLDAARAACREMASLGIVAFHENAAPHIGPESEIPLVRQAAEEIGLHATIYWGELLAIETARRLGAAGLAGDLIADGAFGSRTAALASPYADASQTCGHGYVTAEQVRDHVIACTEAGLQAGFHAIGDAALEAIATGFEEAEKVLGDRINAHHRLEHVEMPSERALEIFTRCGVTASVQPMFDALWGGPDGMYAERLGERWRVTNPLARFDERLISFGSDSPVTSLNPWAAVRAAVHHHVPEFSMPLESAFRAHTSGGWAAAGSEDRHDLSVGAVAHLAVWDVPGGLGESSLPDLTPGVPLPVLRRLLSSGRTIHLNKESSP
ncbi:amidohydrolase [Nocardioides salsibiostraticola]